MFILCASRELCPRRRVITPGVVKFLIAHASPVAPLQSLRHGLRLLLRATPRAVAIAFTGAGYNATRPSAAGKWTARKHGFDTARGLQL